MPIISIKEAAGKCSMEPKNIHTYITRGKLIKRHDGLIDDTLPINEAFFKKYGKEQLIEEKPIIPEIKPEQKAKPKYKKPKEDSDNDYSKVRGNLDDLRAEKLQEEIVALRLKNQRLEGEVIETELIKQATFEVVNAFRTNLFIAAKSALRNTMGDLGADNEQITKAMSNLELLFNAHTSEAIENVKTTIERVL